MDDKLRASLGAIATALSKVGGLEAEIQTIRDQMGAPAAHTDTPVPTVSVSQEAFDALVARVVALETATPPVDVDGAPTAPYDDTDIKARITALETEVEEINEGLDQLASTLGDSAPVDPTPLATAPIATVTTDPGTGGTVIVTTNPADGTTLATPVDQAPTTGTVVVNTTTGEPGIDPTLVDGAVNANVTGDTAAAHPDIVPPETVVAADTSANVAVVPAS